MYIARHIGCNVRALNKIALCKFGRDTWLIENTIKLSDFEKVCAERGAQIILVGVRWAGETIPESKFIYNNDTGILVCVGH